METKFTNLKISKGEWITEGSTVYSLHQIGWDKGNPLMSNRFYLQVYPDYRIENHKEEAEANAKLIADAGNMANKIGLLPSEILAQRDELLEALQNIIPKFEDILTSDGRPFECQYTILNNAKAAIKKATE